MLKCCTNRIHDEVARWVLLFFAKNALASSLNSCMLAANNIAIAVVSAPSAMPLKQKKLLWSYLNALSYLLTKFASDSAIAEMDFPILRYT